jgi:hypothetical protein
MRVARVLALGVLAGALGCGHTKTTDATSPSAPEKAEERTPPADHPDRVPGASSSRAAKPSESSAETSAIPVAASPEGLLAPGAEDQIRDKLADGGYLEKGDKQGSLDAGLRKFQKAKDMPVTGIPDHRTIQALGLDPGRIFKHADVSDGK